MNPIPSGRRIVALATISVLAACEEQQTSVVGSADAHESAAEDTFIGDTRHLIDIDPNADCSGASGVCPESCRAYGLDRVDPIARCYGGSATGRSAWLVVGCAPADTAGTADTNCYCTADGRCGFGMSVQGAFPDLDLQWCSPEFAAEANSYTEACPVGHFDE